MTGAVAQRWRGLVAGRVRLLRLLPGAGGLRLAQLVGWHLLTAVAPALAALTTGWLIRGVVAVVDHRSEWSALWAPLVALVAVFLVIELAGGGVELAGLSAGRRIDQRIRQDLRVIAATPRGIAHLADEAIQDDLSRAAGYGPGRRRSGGAAAVGQLLLLSRVLSALLAAAVLVRFSLLLAVLLFGLCVTVRARLRRQWIDLADRFDREVPAARRVEYWSDALTGAAAAKEIRQFGIDGWLVDRREATARSRLRNVWAARGAVMRQQGPVVAATFGCALAVLLWPASAAARGAITPDQLAAYLVAGWGVLAISAMGPEAFDIEFGTASVAAYDRLRAAAGRCPAAVPEAALPESAAPPESAVPHVVFEGVRFTYPGTDRAAVGGLDLELRPGEVLAIVGPNGAGKTTLVKLLAGLLEPDAGRILVDGVDLPRLDIDRWRARMTAVFQDFVRYPATVRENIQFSGRGDDPAALERAIGQADAGATIDDLPAGLDTPLWRGTADGVDLSSGQWQKIAIARALYAMERGGRLLVLDEPTAHLDVRSEAAFFDRVVAAAAGATVVLISHRLATIRHADRILLLSDGRVAEAGRHDELMDLDGDYAALFRLQAARFVEERAG
jgi:ATP-binding cassette subfamily B protein